MAAAAASEHVTKAREQKALDSRSITNRVVSCDHHNLKYFDLQYLREANTDKSYSEVFTDVPVK